MNESIVKTACSQIGVKEVPGAEHNAAVVGYAQEIGLTWINDDETPWCATFINWVLMKSGLPYLKSARARDFETYGEDTKEPMPGDLVVFFRDGLSSGKGHVGIFLGFDGRGRILCLGGNQGNKVGIVPYNKSSLLSYRRASEDETLDIPETGLKQGNKGDDVKKLQAILKFLGLYSSNIDGDFGPGTANAVRGFQKKHELPQSGVYNTLMRDKIFSLLNE
jgi:uncharacterized protein (TIGR02594 family)